MSTIIPLLTEHEKQHISERQPLPERYLALSDEEMDARITAAKARLGSKLVLPVVSGATAQGTPLPPATALRGQPSRPYAAASNGG